MDLDVPLRELARRRGAGTVRVDSGGTLVGALLRAGLPTEVSLLLHPCLAGMDCSRPRYGRAATARRISPSWPARRSGGLVWLRYETTRPGCGRVGTTAGPSAGTGGRFRRLSGDRQ
ncbi:hypothetical protein GCM10012287_27350 [Streptomyces daqingensis]|uniref:Bacterial bifunctional deaminase-reductase C-terminal domain-containing protein n=1 Tax=Streptomyces daqingensis TaxID=1472640 RepID=A0ABQ2MBG0_9ACTN|nr:hypothetical protein GCM10012287_27350 [Streptomyces daqingensis]